MITLTRLSGSEFALNSDLIERVDSTPDTVITLVDGTKYVVREGLRAVVDAVREYRGAVIAESARMAQEPAVAPVSSSPRRLVAVPGAAGSSRSGAGHSATDGTESDRAMRRAAVEEI